MGTDSQAERQAPGPWPTRESRRGELLFLLRGQHVLEEAKRLSWRTEERLRRVLCRPEGVAEPGDRASRPGAS